MIGFHRIFLQNRSQHGHCLNAVSCAGVLADQRFAKNPSMESVFRTSIFFYVFMNTRYISVIQFKNLISTLNTDLIKLIQKIINN